MQPTISPQQNIAKAMWSSGIAQDHNDTHQHKEFAQNALTVLNKRYLIKDKSGIVTEHHDQLFHRVAHNLAQADLNYLPAETNSAEFLAKHLEETEQEFFNVMDAHLFIPNSPTLMNAGGKLQQLSACFVLPIEDSLDDIFQTVKETALVHKSGGGTGFSFSKLRPRNDIVGSTGGVASGPVDFIRAFDTATDVVKQGGTRRGANMAVLRVDHPDILEFIHSKDSGNALENFNISVAATNVFMQAVLQDTEYDLINPRNGVVTQRLSAVDVWRQIVESAHLTGDPGLIFLDTINSNNPNPHLGPIEAVNPCGEQQLLPNESCNLGSINLARMVIYAANGDQAINWPLLDQVCHTAVHMLDNVIDMNNYPTEPIRQVTQSTRRIGIGVMGSADMFVQMGLPYDSPDARDLASSVMAFINEKTHDASRQLGISRGPYPEFRPQDRDAKPIRNTAPTTIAPTGTISIIANASSGIEPLFALAYTRTVMDQTKMTEVNPYFLAAAKTHGFHSEELMEHVASTGSIQDTSIPQWAKDVFKTSKDISSQDHVLMQAAFQNHVDNGVSKTINFPNQATKEDIQQAYLLAYTTNCKGITVYRDGSKAGQVLSTGDTPAGHPVVPPTVNGRVQARGRPRSMTGTTERVRTAHGNVYVTINRDEDQDPFELFCQVGKAGSCDSAQIEAISRLTSLALRANIDPNEIVTNLRGITCCVTFDQGVRVNSIPDAIAQSLNRIVQPESQRAMDEAHTIPLPLTAGQADIPPQLLCKDCQGPTTFREGCQTCADSACGWSKCE